MKRLKPRTALPPKAPKAKAPGGDRPMGVIPPRLPNPAPMSRGEALSRLRAQAKRK